MKRAAVLSLAVALFVLVACTGKSAVPAPTSTPFVYQGCHVTLVQHSLFEPATSRGVADLPWIQAIPLSSKITGHLFYTPRLPTTQLFFPLYTDGKAPSGDTTKILWIVEQGFNYLTAPMTITGTEIGPGHGTFQQTFDRASGSDIPSIVDVPSPGCWQLTLVTGPWTGTVTFWVEHAS